MTEKAKRGSHGGNARSAKLTPEERSAIAKCAAAKRWAKKDDMETFQTVTLPPIELQTQTVTPSPIEYIVTRAIESVPRPPLMVDLKPNIFIPPPTQVPEPPKPVKKRNKPMVKEFGKAHSYAEKRLAEALKERAESMNKVAMLNAEIPSLVQIIKALGMTPNMNGFQDFTAPIPNMNPYAAPVYQPIPQQQQVEPTGPPPNIDPNLYAANAGPLPGLVPAAKNMPVIPGMSAGGALDLDYVPAPEDEGPGLPKMGSGWF